MDNIIRGGNWYVQELNQRLRLDSVKLPVLRRAMTRYLMGGSYFATELPEEIEPLTADALLNGSHGDIRSRFGRDPGDWTTCSYYESLLDVFPAGQAAGTGAPKLKGRVVILKGLLVEHEQGSVKGLKADGATRFRWGTIVNYHDIVDGKTVHKFDVPTNTLIIDGQNYTAEHNRLIAA